MLYYSQIQNTIRRARLTQQDSANLQRYRVAVKLLLTAKEDMEVVEYTASQQWDALLEVAKAWAKADRRRELESSDEEAEEAFIDDGNGTSEAR